MSFSRHQPAAQDRTGTPEGTGSADEGLDEGLAGWMLSRSPSHGLSAKSAAVVHALVTAPRTASYAGTAEVARLAGVNVATVTRTAQALGFTGWPALKQELRARYLSSLTTLEVAAEHGHLVDAPWAASLRRDRDDVTVLFRRLNGGAVNGVVSAVAGARRTLAVASGSYTAVGMAFTHNARLAGCDVELQSDGAALTNALSRLGQGDALFAMSFWRPYASAVRAAEYCRERQVTVCVLTDSSTGPLAAAADHTLVVPAEGVAFFPSLTPALSVVQALCAELAALDPARTRRSVEASEASRDAFGLLHHRPGDRVSGHPTHPSARDGVGGAPQKTSRATAGSSVQGPGAQRTR